MINSRSIESLLDFEVIMGMAASKALLWETVDPTIKSCAIALAKAACNPGYLVNVYMNCKGKSKKEIAEESGEIALTVMKMARNENLLDLSKTDESNKIDLLPKGVFALIELTNESAIQIVLEQRDE